MEQLFSQAFDIFSDVQRRLQKKVDTVLERNGPDWRMRYGCPACGFKVSSPLHDMFQSTHSFQQLGEEPLVPARMHAIDGCDSQKRDKMVGTCDERIFDSKYFLPCTFVDGFKDEVGSHAAAQKADNTLPNPVQSEDGLAFPEGKEDNHCSSNWKAATSKELPLATKAMFEQTGVFACLCWHGIVEFLMEFVQSGEKYVSVCSLSFLY